MIISVFDRDLLEHDIIEVSEDWLMYELPAYVGCSYPPEDKSWDDLTMDEKVDIFLYHYCEYDPSHCVIDKDCRDIDPNRVNMTPEDYR